YRQSPARLTGFLRPPPSSHLGHQLRDELSGLERLRCRGLAQGLHVMVPGADHGTEIFGPLEEIFPEFEGRVARLDAHLDFRDHAYRQGLCLFRQTYPYVTAALRGRLRRRIDLNQALSQDRAL